MGDISPEQQREYTNIILVIFGACFTLILILAVLIGYLRYMEKKWLLKWRERAAKRSNRHRSTENIEAQDLPLEPMSTFINCAGLSEQRPMNVGLEPTFVQTEGPSAGLTEIESRPTFIRPEGLRERRLTDLEQAAILFHGQEILTNLKSEPTVVRPERTA